MILNILFQSHDLRRHPSKGFPRLGRDKNSLQRKNSRNLFSSKGAQIFCLWPFLGLNILSPDSFSIFWDILSLLPQRAESIFAQHLKMIFFKILMDGFFSFVWRPIETIDYYIIGSPSISIFNILLQSHDVRRHPFKLYPRLGRDKNSQQQTDLTKSFLFQRRRSPEILSLGLFRTQYSLTRFFLDILGNFELTPLTY